MSNRALTIEAVYENGVLRPVEPLPLQPQQRVTLTLHMPSAIGWPEDVAAIYAELAEEDRRLAEAMFPSLRQTWPAFQE